MDYCREDGDVFHKVFELGRRWWNSVETGAGVHFAGRIPSYAVFLLEDFFFALPEQVAASHLRGGVNLFLRPSPCLLDCPSVSRIISDRVVENADFRVGAFIGLPGKLAAALKLGIGRRLRFFRQGCPHGCSG